MASILAGACTGSQGEPGAPGAPGSAGSNGSSGSNGSNGANGTNALVASVSESPGTNCPNGGTKIEVGLDTNNNGTLDATEVTGTSYVCNGSGLSSLVVTSAEPAGANCPYGGEKIQSGLDANNDGVLQPTEVSATGTSYVCNVAPAGSVSPSTGIHVNYIGAAVSTTAGAPITVHFNLKDDRGYPLDINGVYSLNTPIQPRFAIGYVTTTQTTATPPVTVVGSLKVYTQSTSAAVPTGQPTNYNPVATVNGSQGTLVENGYGAGEYTYTFPTSSVTPYGVTAVAYDAAHLGDTHVVWMQITRQTDLQFTANANTFSADNKPYYYIPSGVGTPIVREIAKQSNCDNCHAKFKAETTTSAAFHGGGRVDVGMCNVCHNPDHTSNLDALSSSFVHRIHNGENVLPANQFHAIAATYPRDIKHCDTCHANAAQGGQAQSNPTIAACRGCHDYVSFTDGNGTGNAAKCSPGNLGANGLPVPCNHFGGKQVDGSCAGCHGPGNLFGFPTVAQSHQAVEPPDPTNIWNVPVTGNANTNASYLAWGGVVPLVAAAETVHVITYDVKSVQTAADAVTPAIKHPSITFKLKDNGTDVAFPAAGPTVTKLIPNFNGSPSVYFAFAVPQDGNPTPTDFNASASGYILKILNGTATGAGAGTITGPDATGYYTIVVTGAQVPAAATMLTGGVGYTYSLSSAAPMVQTDLTTSYPISTDGKNQGGLSVPAPVVWKVATGYTGRRAIVDNNKCNNCHGRLGVAPTFHAGQRNDGPTCSFCHNPNRTSSGWSAGSKYYIHAIHAGRKRVVSFTWHAVAAGPGYGEVAFPGTLNSCPTCHVPNTYDFTNTTNLAAVPNMQLYTVATGKYDPNPLVNSTYYTLSPYVTYTTGSPATPIDYGVGFSFNANTAVTVEAAPTTLVISPIMTACSACHDTPIALNHMQDNGGIFYKPRSSVPGYTNPPTAPIASTEECLICHGPGRIAAIGNVHQH